MGFEIKLIPLTNLVLDKEQPRKDYVNINEFSESLKTNLVEYPLLVETINENKYLIIDGHRRLLASKKVGLKELWCKVYTKLSNLQRLELRVNLEQHKANWKISERDVAWVNLFKLLKEKTSNFTRADFAKRVGVSWDTINDAFDRINLGLDGNMWDTIPPSYIHETQGLDKNIRIELLQSSIKDGWGRDRLRQEVRERKSIFKTNGEIHEGLQFHSKAPEIIGEGLDFKPTLTFVFNKKEDRDKCIKYFCKDSKSEVPNGEKLLILITNAA